MRILQIILFMLIVIFSGSGFAHEFAENENFNFRKTNWGMSREEVIKSEGISAIESSKTTLTFKSILAKKNVLVEYYFLKNRLIRASYFINHGYYDPSKHYYDFVLLDKLLKKQYSGPNISKKIWSASEDVKNRVKESEAVYLGYLSLVSKWEITGTSISHVLKKTGIAGGIEHSIKFSNKAS